MAAAEEQADERRAQVFEAAMLAIAELGMDRVGMREIAVRAGMSPGHILYYFGRKDRLLLGTLVWSEADLGERRHTALRSVRSPTRRLARFVELYLPTGPNDVRWNLWAQLIARPPLDREDVLLVSALERAWIDDLAALVRDGVAKTVFMCGDAHEFAVRYCKLLDGLANDILMGTPEGSRAAALRLATRAMERDLGLSRGDMGFGGRSSTS